ncbi:MAG: hypothetical protein HYW38_00360 [Candidatus Colwellbacteria bacterium]|nr:hypothetical protein [Candidatus Colwellbacteria bacterium]
MVRKIPAKAVRKIRKESEELQREIRRKTMTYIAAALGLVTGLAWNEAIKSILTYFFPLDQNTVIAKVIYALLMTIILVFVTAYILKGAKEEKR